MLSKQQESPPQGSDPPATRPLRLPAGNDFSRIFAPLIRDGRMDKYHWAPTEEDLVGILFQAS